MVHGWLGDENAMWAFASTLPPNALAISMRAPFESEGGYGWMVPDEKAGTIPHERGGSLEHGLAALDEFVRRLPGEFPVDTEKVSLVGFSQGAAMSYALALSHPPLVSGVAALSGDLPEQARRWVSPGRLKARPVFIAHGENDNVVPIEEAIGARDAMLLCGAAVTYRSYDIGHKLSAQGMRDLKSWLADFAA